MSFELTIKADSPDAFAQQLIQAAFLVAPNLSERFAPPKLPAETAAPAEPEKKPRGRKAAENVAKKETKATNDATNDAAMADAAGADGVGDGSDAVTGTAIPAGAAGGTADGTVSEAEPAEAKAEAPEPVSESEAAPVGAADPDSKLILKSANQWTMSIDELRAYTVRSYLNACFDKQDDRRDAFRALCQQFEVEAIGKLPADKIGEFKKVVDEKIAEYEAKKKAAMKAKS